MLDEEPRPGDSKVRPAWTEDLPVLAGRDGFRYDLLAERLNRRAAGRGELLVACCDGVPVGHVYIWCEPAEENDLRRRLPGVPLIMNLWVREDRRNRGIGTALTTAAEEWLRERRYPRVALAVVPENTDATRLYLRLDYDPWEFADVKLVCREFSADGDGARVEVCAVLVKELQQLN